MHVECPPGHDMPQWQWQRLFVPQAQMTGKHRSALGAWSVQGSGVNGQGPIRAPLCARVVGHHCWVTSNDKIGQGAFVDQICPSMPQSSSLCPPLMTPINSLRVIVSRPFLTAREHCLTTNQQWLYFFVVPRGSGGETFSMWDTLQCNDSVPLIKEVCPSISWWGSGNQDAVSLILLHDFALETRFSSNWIPSF